MNLRKKIPLFILSLSFISTIVVLFEFNYVSIVSSIISLILSLIFSRKHIRILLITLFISTSTVFTNIFILDKEKNIDIDIFKNTNILLGTWNYNFDGGSYVFEDDYTYIKYDSNDNFDNYCIGKYKYSYGGIGDNGEIIKQDNNYYYYNFFLTEESCIISNQIFDRNNKLEMVFGVSKTNYNELIFINKEDDYAYILSKVLE